MQPQPTIPQIPVSKSGVVVVDGYGIHLRVERGHLIVSDGIGPNRRQGRFTRAQPGFRRLVLLGHTGFVTLDALRWLADVGIGWIHLDPDGRVLGTSSSLRRNDPRLRRAQAAAWGTAVGLSLARDLLRLKLRGQGDVALGLPNGQGAAEVIDRLIPELAGAGSPADLMLVEAAAAAVYWEAWAEVEISWTRVDRARVPSHWQTVGSRGSPLTSSPRLATTPVHALLNLAYAIVEAEAHLACLAVGLDPGLGVLHADQKARDSLALDVMEAVRPDVDRQVLGLLRTSVFRASDFHETRQGVCRVLPPHSHELIVFAANWAKGVAPVVEKTAAALERAEGSKRFPTPLTQSNRSRGRDNQRRKAHLAPVRPTPVRARSLCRGCGAETAGTQRWCRTCRAAVKLDAGLEGLRRARAERARLHKQGRDPSTSDRAKAKNRDGRMRRRAEERAWDEAHPERPDVQDYLTNVLPRVQRVPVRQLAHATGLSVTHCAYIRKGLRTPHHRWWGVLATAGQTAHDDLG